MKSKAASEKEQDAVYGASFALYDKKALIEFIEPFRVRFDANGLSPKELFQGRRCLDAGCGNGRGSLFMLEHGASHVTAVDISATNVNSTAVNLSDFGFKNFETRLSSLETLPFDAETFDFVWCNGVLMHTANPDRCLAELARVLIPGGRTWIYVYGAGGVYWHFVRFFRRMLNDVPAAQLIASLRLLNYSTRFVGEYVDDWKTPYLRAYPQSTFSDSLRCVGFGDVRRLMAGMPYDTSARIERFPDERKWLGEGDLRFLATKTGEIGNIESQLTGFSIDDPPTENDSAVVETFDSSLRALERAGQDSLPMIAACARLQHFLRESVLAQAGTIDIAVLKCQLSETRELLDQVSRR